MKRLLIFLLSISYFFATNASTDVKTNGFLHASGKWIVDGNGKKILLRGIGLGNYLLIEPYMLGINNAKFKKSDTQQAILNSLGLLGGAKNVEIFLDTYQKNYVTENDVHFLKTSGFNSIRLPMHYNLFIEKAADNNQFIEKGFVLIDSLLSWCKKHEMYLILDMHAVPGGQSTDKAISDQYSPGLWDGDSDGTAAQYQTKLIVLWKEIARRYAGENWIGGYDLINEIQYYPSRGLAPEIRDLYERLTRAIRETDQNHLLFIEGNGYANDHTGLTPPWDDNMAYSFHRYWCPNTQATIQYMINLRETYLVPVWMGESGENSNTWFTDAIELLEKNEIGWAWWSYKKVANISGVVSIPRPTGWDKILSFLESGTDNSISLGLDVETTRNILMELAGNTRLEKSEINKDVIYALISQPFNNETKPYRENRIPGNLFASEYDLGRNDFGYKETGLLSREYMEAGAYNEGWIGRNDAVDIEYCNDPSGNGFNIGWTTPGEWLDYTVDATQKGRYKIKISYAVPGTGNLNLKLNGNDVLSNIPLIGTGAWNTYKTEEIGSVDLNTGENTIRLIINKSFNFSCISFEYLGDFTPVESIKVLKKIEFNGIFPNPAESQTSFRFSVNEPVDRISFEIYNLRGESVDSIHLYSPPSGNQSIEYTKSLKPGFYFNTMKAIRQGKTIYEKTYKMIYR